MPLLDITSDLVGLQNVLVTRLDVEDPASIRSAIASSIACFGGIDVVVNNAGDGLDTTRAILPHFRALSYELSSQGIRIKIVEPGGTVSTSFAQRSGTEVQVAECIYAAATDGTDQLRYLATDDIKPLVEARRETPEAEDMALTRTQFGWK